MAELFKFRCYSCQKLIGTPASRFGSVVKCPKCGVELIVPSPTDEPDPEPEPDPDAFRLEDLGLRIEPEPISRPVVAPTAPPLPVGPDPIAYLQQVAEAGDEGSDDPSPVSGESEPEPGETSDLPEAEVEPLVSRTRSRTASQIDGRTSRARDVVLPRTAAVAWALFALLGLAFAFTTGLLIGQRLGK